MLDLLALDFMRNALLAALLVGVAAPLVGIFLVQRRMSLIGDGIGHVALAGVGVGIFTGSSPVWTALVAAVVAAVVIELVQRLGRTSGDLALAVMFYGGIAAGVVIIARSPSGTPANLTGYLFGAINTVSRTDLVVFAVLSLVVILVTTTLRGRLFAVAQDEEYARATGLPVLGLNVLLAVLTAVTVVVSMRVIGLLLISALMILPNASGQFLGRSFRASLRWAVLIGLLTSVGGVVVSFYADTPSGGTIVLLAIAVFALAGLAGAVRTRLRRGQHAPAEEHDHVHWAECGHEAIPHGDHVDYLHDGHRHASHGDHWDEHSEHEHDPMHPHAQEEVARG
ncbi:metal ABC transporter permease [Janibacter sp. YIM B02568]|uniref:metal ABC transporter permease n=1 Tax=Janibacter endophyticus TaxID=2806261 RepID=UPI00194F5ADC|nr:metal ABC transporter permease [Janibacter endophyticus]MBM6546655.1 metal ABC transporter permease [Janibacter endophyticus]